MAHSVAPDRHPGLRQSTDIPLVQEAGRVETSGHYEEGCAQTAAEQGRQSVNHVGIVAVVEADAHLGPVHHRIKHRSERLQVEPGAILARLGVPLALADPVKGQVDGLRPHVALFNATRTAPLAGVRESGPTARRKAGGCPLVSSPMDAVTILRELWRRRVLVALVAFAALLVGFLLAYRVGFPPEPRKYEVGVATARVLVDTPQSQVIKVDPRGSDTLGLRASVLANLMVEGEAKAAIARRAGLKPRKLKAVSASATALDESGSDPQPVSTEFPDDPDVHMIRTRVIANPDGEQLPIIETDVQAPDAASATKLANATIAGLTDYLDRRAAADEDVEERSRLRVSGLGGAQAVVAARGPGRAVAAAAAIFLFVAGCGAILLVSAFPRSWRAAEVSDHARQRAWPRTTSRPTTSRSMTSPWTSRR